MITEPSPRMVLPLNIVMWRRIGATGLTTISSVSKTRSTMMPSVVRADLGHDDAVRSPSAAPASLVLLEAQQVVQVDQRQQPVAQAQHRACRRSARSTLPWMSPRPCVLRAHQFDHADLRDGEALAAGLDDQRRDDRQRQRDLDGEGGALARRCFCRSMVPPMRLDVGLHHVHADAAAGDGGDRGGGGEAGAEDEALDLRLAHAGQFGLGRQAVRQHLGADLVDRQAAAVVGDLDDDVAAFVERVQRDVAGLRLAGGAAFGRAFPARGRRCCAPCASADP